MPFNLYSFKKLLGVTQSIFNLLVGLVDTYVFTVNSDFKSQIDTRMAAFIVFIIVLVVAYLILWMPFVSKLNKEVYLIAF